MSPASHSFMVADMADVTAAVMLVPKLELLRDGAETDRYLVATIVSELASNIVKYAGRGVLRLNRNEQHGNVDIEIWAEDHGPGIPDTASALSDHFSTGGTLGLGLPGVRRMADSFEIVSTTADGTRILACKRIRGVRPGKTGLPVARERIGEAASPGVQMDGHTDWDAGSACRPMTGQRQCGDAAIVMPAGDSLLLAIIDASGHGARAHEVADAALSLLRREASARVETLLERLELELRGTAGAAVGLMAVNRDNGQFRYAGVGNTRAAKIGAIPWRGVSRDGVLGNHSRRAQVQHDTLAPGDTVVLWTDGLPEAACADFVRTNSFREAGAIARLLIRQLARTHDDAGCLILKWRR